MGREAERFVLRSIIFALVILAFASSMAGCAQKSTSEIRITLEYDSERERSTAAQLRRVLREYDVDQWIFTPRVHIAERSIPHSHPVLTLHTRHLDNDLALLAVFLHEQFHWLEEGSAGFAEAVDAFEEAYPDAPVGGPEGAHTAESTYSHLLVCDLEFQAMSQLVGEGRSRDVLSVNEHYTWIYERVLNDPQVRDIATAHGFRLSDD